MTSAGDAQYPFSHYCSRQPHSPNLQYTRNGNITVNMTSSMAQPAFWILTSLAGGRRHGYEIMRETAVASGERVSLKATTLYAALDRLERERLIRPDGEEVVNGRARRYYRITDDGSARLSVEVELLEHAARAARASMSTSRAASVFPHVAVV